MTEKYNFLKSLALRCKEHFQNNCDQLNVIFPNKRAGIYFVSYLSELYDRPIWSPQIYSFEEYLESQQEAKLADELRLNLLLYEVYSTLVPNAESFDSFMPWGEMILKDFGDIDNYLVNTEHIFKIVKSQKELDEAFYFLSEHEQKIIQRFWRGFLPEPNKKQDEFMKTWSILHPLYEQFNEKLKKYNLVYKGRMFREFAQGDIDNNRATWFAGFNALTKAEETIIKKFLEIDGNDIFWDLDEYYLKDLNQEAGHFFRTYQVDNHFKKSIERDVKNVLNEENRIVDLVACSFSTGQILAATQCIEDELLGGTNPADLLLVLADEQMLPPLISHLPSGLEDINITMGWPMTESSVFSAIEMLSSLKMRLEKPDFKAFHFEEVLSLCEFPDILRLPLSTYRSFKSQAILSNEQYYSLERLNELFPSIGKILASPNVDGFLSFLIMLLEEINRDGLRPLDQSVCSRLHQDLKHLQSSFHDGKTPITFSSFQKVIRKLGQSGKVPLVGDPSSGLQIMGTLETRNLSFKKVMILGMNEGNWPSGSANSSFIPYNIRKAFDLPTIEQQDAIQAYLFYRLVQSSTDLSFFYNNVAEFNHNGELSRFVQQLQHESQIEFSEQQALSTLKPEALQPIVIQKDEEVQRLLDVYRVQPDQRRQLSPSALNTYLDCRLKFYFQYVQRIKETEALIEDIDPALLGNLLHGTMEYLYADKDTLDKATLDEISLSIDKALNTVFAQEKLPIEKGQIKIGRQVIAYEVVKRYVEKIIAYDSQGEPFKILGLESELSMELDLFDGSRASLKGIIDRIDQQGDAIRIMDYKSGRDDRLFKDVESLFDRSVDKRSKAVFQLFYYSALYLANHLTELPIRPGLFNSKDLFDDNFDALIYQSGRPKKPVLSVSSYQDEFREHLTHLVQEIFDSNIDFTQTEDIKKCTYCPYINICKRG